MLLKDYYSVNQLNVENDVITALININAKHAVFDGHFPGNPIVPGVTMVQIVKEVLGQSLNQELFLSKAVNIKFMAILNPNEDPEVQVNIKIKSKEDNLIAASSTITKEDKTFFKFSGQFRPV